MVKIIDRGKSLRDKAEGLIKILKKDLPEKYYIDPSHYYPSVNAIDVLLKNGHYAENESPEMRVNLSKNSIYVTNEKLEKFAENIAKKYEKMIGKEVLLTKYL